MARMLGRRCGLWLLVGALAGCGPALPVSSPDYVRSATGGYVLADPPPGMTVRLGSKPLLNKADAAAPDASRSSASR
jgi:hypothetical protein